MVHDFDWAGAEEEFKLALELSPGAADIYDHYGWLCGALERYDEALALVRRAQELDPLTHRADVATTLLRAGRHEEALQAALALRRVRSRVRAGALHAGLGLSDNGMAGEGSGRARAGGDAGMPGHPLYLAQLGEAYGLTGKTGGGAGECCDSWRSCRGKRYVSPYHWRTSTPGWASRIRRSRSWSEAYEERAGNVYGIKGSFLFTSLKEHPRFQALLAKMNLA